MFMGADIVVKIVMIGLAFASLITWTICVAKLLELRHETKRAKKRIKVLANDISLMEAERDARSGKDAVSRLVQSAAAEAALSDTVNDEGLIDTFNACDVFIKRVAGFVDHGHENAIDDKARHVATFDKHFTEIFG